MRKFDAEPRLVRVTLIKSHQHCIPSIRKTVEALGLRYVNHSIVHKNVTPIRGLINKVSSCCVWLMFVRFLFLDLMEIY